MMRRTVALLFILGNLSLLVGCGLQWDRRGGNDSTFPQGNSAGTSTGGTTGSHVLPPIVSHPTNMLNNGGFEYGMMCYGEWQVDSTQVDWAPSGGYRWSMSSDAHSGNYSLEVRCEGSDCLNVTAPKFTLARTLTALPVEAGKSYVLSFWNKCPAGEQADLKSTGAASLWIDLKCTGNWEQSRKTFSAGAADGDAAIAIEYYGKNYMRMDDLVITYADGTVPEQITQHPGTRSVSVSEKAVNVDGSPYLALGFYGVPYESLADAAATGANTLMFNGADCTNTARPKYADRAYELGLNLAPESSSASRIASPFDEIAERFAPHLANIGWYLDDEPDQFNVPWMVAPAPTFLSNSQLFKSKSSLPVMSCFQRAAWSSPSDYAPYTDGVDLWMAEPYGNDFSSTTRAIDGFNSLAKRPIWLAQDDLEPSLLLAKAYWVVGSGATGIIYFAWATFEPQPEKLAAAKQVFGELSSLRPVIFGSNIDAVTASDTTHVRFIARRSGGKQYLISGSSASATVSFSVPGLAAGHTITVLFENRTLTSTNGQFSDTFTNQARHVYRID